MQLDSYLEIFTTMYGWAFANIMGEIVTGTGLIALPFALIVFNAWRDAKENGTASGGIIEVIEAVTVKLVVAMFVMAVCFATTPATSLLSLNLNYRPNASAAGAAAAQGSLRGGTGSGYDSAMADASDGSMSPSGNLSYVPAWWYTVMAISSGANNAIRNAIRSDTNSIRQVEDMARTATIDDPKLLHDIQRFYSECFVPARSRYLRMAQSDLSGGGAAILANKDYGPTDVDWMGSQLFRKEPGFYDTMRSYNPVPGFAINFARDTDYIQTPAAPGTPEAGYQNPDWGRPTCNEWWDTPTTGVRDELVDHSATWRKLLTTAGNAMTWTSAEARKDAFARLAQTKANPVFVDSDRVLGNDYDKLTTLGRVVTGAVSTFGLAKKALEASIAMVPLLNGLPMLQALVLMGLYMFLPLITFLSGFDLKIMFLGAIGIFTVKFWAVMWFIAQWVDAHLIAALYPGLQGNILVQELTQMTSGTLPSTYKRMLLNVLLMLMFVGLPMLWTAMMAWIGVRVGHGITDLTRSTGQTADSTASASTSIASKGRR